MISDRVGQIVNFLPEGVSLLAAAKTRSYDEVMEAIQGGVNILGYNYLQEAEQMYKQIGDQVQWHMIGHLQRNKAKKAVQIFDMIETVDSYKLAENINRHCGEMGKNMPILIEINSGRESNKTGVFPEMAMDLVRQISLLKNVKVQGLMTMGRFTNDPEDSRPFFKTTKESFDQITKENIANVEMRYLSMGMSNSYLAAIEEGANIVRIGTKLFGTRNR